MMRRFLAALAMSVLAVPARAQAVRGHMGPRDTTTVLPGDARLDVNQVVPHRATWRVTVHDSAGRVTPQGLWTDIWGSSVEAGRPVMVFRQLYVDTAGSIVVDNEAIFDAATFRAIRAMQRQPSTGAWASYRYRGDSASGSFTPSADTEPREFTVMFGEPVWEPLVPLVALFPKERLEPGAVLRYPIWNQAASGDADNVTWIEVRVDSVGSMAPPAGPAVRVWYLTHRDTSVPNMVMHIRQIREPPWAWWLRVERPGLTREWTLVDWQPFVRVPAAPPR